MSSPATAATSSVPASKSAVPEKALKWIETSERPSQPPGKVQTAQHYYERTSASRDQMRMAMKNPLVPFGMIATVTALVVGLAANLRGDRWKQQMMMRYRVGFQAFTVMMLVGGMAAAQNGCLGLSNKAMNNGNFQLAEKLLGSGGSTYVNLAKGARRTRENMVRDILHHKKLPKEPWDDQTVEFFLEELAALDSNNFPNNVGVGEREGRVYSDLVKKRHFRMTHGIGRSGDLTAIQPKAVGSSLLNKLVNALVLDAIRVSGVKHCQACFVAPLATGMALSLCMQYFRRQRLSSSGQCKFVIWMRIDQKSCFKSILTAGLEPIIIQPRLAADELVTDVDAARAAVKRVGAENIACIFTTTSCFAPRTPDDVVAIAKLCQEHNLPHLINNAYGLQAARCCNLIEEASRVGRIDLFVQSTDKNFMVPVGGAVIAGFDAQLVKEVAESYPGRASSTPSMDVLITLLSMGENGYRRLLREREENYSHLSAAMEKCSKQHGERMLETKRNPISMAMTITSKEDLSNGDKSSAAVTRLGSMLFTRQCSGARVVAPREKASIEGFEFVGWGSHCAAYPHAYLNVAAAIGMRKEEIDHFVRILGKALSEMQKRQTPDEAESCNGLLVRIANNGTVNG